jgi:molecular chaperone DnaJ
LSKKDFYTILGVTKSSSAEEIKKAYRKLAMLHHPDKNLGNKKAEEKFKEISEAYDILSDPTKKKNYDQFGSADGNPFSQQSSSGFNPFGQASHQQPDFNDIFGDLFGGAQEGPFGSSGFGRQRARSRPPARGSDLRYTLTITYEDVYAGAEKVIFFARQKGQKEDNAKLSVTVPAGVKEGQRLKLAGEGDHPQGAQPGDLYVILSIQNHLLFKREENDLLLDVPIKYTDILLGTEIEIPTLSGKSQIKIAAGTASGQILRLKGKGFPRIGQQGFGDMLVKVIVDIPSTINSEQKQMLQSLKETTEDTPLVKLYKEKLSQVLKNR